MGKRIVILGDTCSEITLDEGALRNLVGGDMLYARGLNRDPHPFRMMAKPLMNCNNYPRFDVTQDDIREKVKVFEFTHTFVKSAAANALMTAYQTTHRDQFFTYFARGAHDYSKHGLRTCPWLDDARGRFLATLGAFFDSVVLRTITRAK